MINHNLEDKNYVSILTSIKNKTNIGVKLRTTLVISILKQDIKELLKWHGLKISHHCDTKMFEDENYFLFHTLILDHNFKIFVTISTFLTFCLSKYGDLGIILLSISTIKLKS